MTQSSEKKRDPGVYMACLGAYARVMPTKDKLTCGPGFASNTDTSSSATEATFQQDIGNAAMVEGLMCTPDMAGAMGRVFGKVVGGKSAGELAEASFTREDLKAYLNDHLMLAQGQFFRNAKVGGAADAIMEELDHDVDGQVGWAEFQAFRDRMRENLLPGVSASAGSGEIEEKARELFLQMQTDGSVGYEKIESETLAQLPADTDHKSLVAQLGALLVLDIVDLDEQSKEVKDRSITEDEWLSAVKDVAGVKNGDNS